MIPRAERAEKHRHAAEWIESLGRPHDHAEMLAHHYLQALELARASGQATAELAERGRRVLRDAGDRATALNAFDAAAGSYASALELWPVDDPERPRLLLALGTAMAFAGVGDFGQPQLAEAAEGLVALGDPEHAAEAEILLADGQWGAGHRDRAYEHIGRATALLEGVPSSSAKARVLSEVSRYHMLAESNEEAIATGQEALAMATELGLDAVRAHALNNIGVARVLTGDRSGIENLEASIEIAKRIGSPESLRAHNNLFSVLWLTGSLDRAAEAVTAGMEATDRFPAAAPALWLKYQRVPIAYARGRWDEALNLIEETLDESRPVHYLARWAIDIRGRVRLARGEKTGAVDDAEKGLALGREAKDPQTLYPALSFAAFAFSSIGRLREAELLANELLELDAAGRRSADHTGLRSRLGAFRARSKRRAGRGGSAFEGHEPLDRRRRRDRARRAAAGSENLRGHRTPAERGLHTTEGCGAARRRRKADRGRRAATEGALILSERRSEPLRQRG